MSKPPADKLHPVAFWYLRHGETDWNAQNLSQGNVDIPLNETGLAQARSASLMLRNRGITSIISSPLSRAKVTADIAAAQLGLPVQVDDGLKEVAFGIMEGKPMSEWFQPWIDGLLTPGRRRTLRRPHHPRRRRRQPLHHPARQSCWSSPTAPCSGPCAAPWATSRTGAPATPSRSGASRPPAAPIAGQSPTPTAAPTCPPRSTSELNAAAA